MFNVQEFKSYVGETGTSPKNRYVVSMGIPQFLYQSQILVNSNLKSFLDIDKHINFRAENVSIPNISLTTSQVSRYGIGPIQRFATNAQMNDITMEFLVDRERLIWIYFYHWMNNVFSFNQVEPNDRGPDFNSYSYRASYMDDYKAYVQIYIYNYDALDKNSTLVEIYDAYPVSIEQIELGWADNNTTMKIRVRFSYRDWRITNTSTSDGSTQAPGPPGLDIPPRETLASLGSKAIDFIKNLVK